VASGLQAAHVAGLIHRDVKPGNILFADAHTAKITDFGLALLAEQEAESRGEIWGTPYYIAPEKLNNQPEDFRSDIYSLGATLYELLTEKLPFPGDSDHEVRHRIRSEEPTDPLDYALLADAFQRGEFADLLQAGLGEADAGDAGALVAEQDARRVFCSARNRHADRVEDADLGPVHGVCRQGVVLQFIDFI
jgi:serine/threonine protein kinase